MDYSKNKKIVISNHTDKFIEWIDIVYEYGYTKDNIIIYDRTGNDPSRLNMYGTVIKSPNIGSNIYDIGRYIYENYDNIEEKTGMDCTKWLVNQWLDGAPVVDVVIHSANAVGSGNMQGYINNYRHIHRLPQNCVRVQIEHTV